MWPCFFRLSLQGIFSFAIEDIPGTTHPGQAYPRSQCLASCGPRPNSVADSRLRLTGLSCAVLKLTAETMRLQLGSFLTLEVAEHFRGLILIFMPILLQDSYGQSNRSNRISSSAIGSCSSRRFDLGPPTLELPVLPLACLRVLHSLLHLRFSSLYQDNFLPCLLTLRGLGIGVTQMSVTA